MKKKFLDIVTRHTELATKHTNGVATADDLVEMKRLGKVINAVVGKNDDKVTTTLTTMTLGEYREWNDATLKSIEDGNADVELLTLVKRNLAAIKTQGKTSADDIVAVEMPVEKTDGDRIAALESRIAELEAQRSDDSPDPDVATDANKQDKKTAQALALEAIDTLIERYNKIKAAIEGDNLSRENLDSLFDREWPLKEIISQAAAVMAKFEKLNLLAMEIKPVLDELVKDDDTDDTDADANVDADVDDKDTADDDKGDNTDSDADVDDKDTAADDADDDSHEGGDTQKTQKKLSTWLMGLDIAPKATAEEHIAAIKENHKRKGY